MTVLELWWACTNSCPAYSIIVCLTYKIVLRIILLYSLQSKKKKNCYNTTRNNVLLIGNFVLKNFKIY